MKESRQLDLACLPIVCLGAAPLLLLLAGKWGSFTPAKILISTVSLLAALGVIQKFGRERYSVALEELPFWAPIPALFAVWTAILTSNAGAVSLAILREAAILSFATFLTVFGEDMWTEFTIWAHSDLKSSPAVPKWVTTPSLFAFAAAIYWLAKSQEIGELYLAAATFFILATVSLFLPPMKL